jgi:hypothetical protein
MTDQTHPPLLPCDPATLALARLGAAYLHDGTRHPVHFWKEVTLALHTPGVRERIAELLGEEGA